MPQEIILFTDYCKYSMASRKQKQHRFSSLTNNFFCNSNILQCILYIIFLFYCFILCRSSGNPSILVQLQGREAFDHLQGLQDFFYGFYGLPYGMGKKGVRFYRCPSRHRPANYPQYWTRVQWIQAKTKVRGDEDERLSCLFFMDATWNFRIVANIKHKQASRMSKHRKKHETINSTSFGVFHRWKLCRI